MASYFFDQIIGAASEVDDEGTDFFDPSAAQSAAFELLGEAIILERARLPIGELAVLVRDKNGPVLRVSATVVAEQLTPNKA